MSSFQPCLGNSVHKCWSVEPDRFLFPKPGMLLRVREDHKVSAFHKSNIGIFQGSTYLTCQTVMPTVTVATTCGKILLLKLPWSVTHFPSKETLSDQVFLILEVNLTESALDKKCIKNLDGSKPTQHGWHWYGNVYHSLPEITLLGLGEVLHGDNEELSQATYIVSFFLKTDTVLSDIFEKL